VGAHEDMTHALSFRPLLSALACAAALSAPASANDQQSLRGLLDGLTFDTDMHVPAVGETYESQFSFENGRFYSMRCNMACNFGWTEYDAWEEDGATYFSVVMTCDEAPHTVTWSGRIEGDVVEGTGVWRTDRWYWSVAREAVYAGERVDQSDAPIQLSSVDG
jgi:hypothetical protein